MKVESSFGAGLGDFDLEFFFFFCGCLFEFASIFDVSKSDVETGKEFEVEGVCDDGLEIFLGESLTFFYVGLTERDEVRESGER